MTKDELAGKANKSGLATRQPQTALGTSAAVSETLHSPIEPTSHAPRGGPSHGEQAQAIEARLQNRCPAYTCKVALKLAFFFDGTGNNLDADEATDEHSNVGRLYKSHPDNDPSIGLYRFYVPGLGTYFPDIGDVGDDDGLAFGKHGEQRLDKAMQWLKETIARHPAEKIIDIRLSVFGFSRGAALARAFARRIAAACVETDGGHVWPSAGKVLSIEFMGLFDTVASVGAPASTGSLSIAIAKKWTPLDKGLDQRRAGVAMTGLNDIAFGERAGADPTQAVYDGHMSWGRNLRVPSVVKQLTHLMAMHEVRNSFPAETVWDGKTMPVGAVEMVYPGVHSNVGGGYRPGESGKSLASLFMLSKLPLRKMYDDARRNGVPLLPLDNPRIKGDFEYDQALTDRFNATCAATGWSHGNLGTAILAHMRTYYRWRFGKIKLKLAAEAAGQRLEQEREIAKQEQVFAGEARGVAGAEGLQARVQRLETDPTRRAAEKDMDNKKAAWLASVQQNPGASDRRARASYEDAKRHYDNVSDPYLQARGKLRTLPAHSGELLGALDAYDHHLLKDVQTLKALQTDRATRKRPSTLRPHYKALLEAHDDEFIHHRGIDPERDKLVIEFFDNFVHDSLAGFARDATLPSDPRCYYVGGDNELKYADLRPVFASSVVG